VYYDDDGATYDYEKGSFFKQEIRTWADANGTSLVLGSRTVNMHRPCSGTPSRFTATLAIR